MTHYTKQGKLKRGRPPKEKESSRMARAAARKNLTARENDDIVASKYPTCKCSKADRIPLGSVKLGVDDCRRCELPFRRDVT